MTRRFILCVVLGVIGNLSASDKGVIAEGPFKPTIESLSKAEISEWIQDAKLGFWAHWGPQSQPAKGDWYARCMYEPRSRGHMAHHLKTYGHPSEFGFKDLIYQWKAEKFTPEYADYLMKLYKNAGAQFFVSIAHHHDNFDLWDSKHHAWNAVDKGPEKNIFGMWEKAARSNGLRFGLTSHLVRSPVWWAANKGADKEGPKKGVWYDGADPAYADLYHPVNWKSDEYQQHWKKLWFNRLKDVIDQHRPDFIYVDGGIPLRESYGYQLVAHYYNQNIADNNGKLEAFILSKELEDRDVGMYDIEYSVMLRKMPFTWMSDTFIGHWFWNSDYENGKMPHVESDFQIDHLIDVISKNGVVMMVIPQRGDGSIHDRIIQTLKEMADWMKVNAEGIHYTRPWKVYGEGPSILKPGVEDRIRSGNIGHRKNRSYRAMFYDFGGYNEKHLRYTCSKDGKIIYAFVLGWPGAGKKVYFNALNSIDNPVFKSVELLGHGPVEFKQDQAWLVVTMPEKAPFEQAVCLKVQ